MTVSIDPAIGRPTVRLRQIGSADLPAAAALSGALRWPHRPEDWAQMLRCGDGIVAVLPDGAVIGTTLWWRFGDRASIGLVIVADGWQGRGVGRRMMTDARRRLQGCGLSLCATLAGRPLYETLGFRTVGLVEQRQGAGISAPTIGLPDGERVRPLVPQDVAGIVALDAQATGAARVALIELLSAEASGAVVDGADGIAAYGFCRRFGRGWLIGPVGARRPDAARALVVHWLRALDGAFVRMDIPDGCGLSDWLDGLGLPRVDKVSVMADGTNPVAGGGYYALAAQAIG